MKYCKIKKKVSALLKGAVILLVLSLSLKAEEKIKIPGFGELPVKRNGTSVEIDFGGAGAFNFSGTVNPLSLTTKVSIDELKHLPGFNLYSKLGLDSISLTISRQAVEVTGSINTSKNLGKLFNFFKINEPTLEVTSVVSREGFELEGALDFSEKPIVIDIRPDRTRMTLKEFAIGAQISKGVTAELSIGVSANVLLKPTRFDPDINTVLEFSYNLKSQEISVAGSMVDKWVNPLGMGQFFKGKEVVSIENTGMEIGWIPGTPSPTTLGFALEAGKFFHLEFGMVMSLSLDDGKIALKAHRNEMTMNDLTKILREGFGLKLPDAFPQDIYIKDVEIKFSPLGGSVGEIPIEQGFRLTGRAKLTDVIEADLEFYADLDNGAKLEYTVINNFGSSVLDALKKRKALHKLLTPILNTVKIREVYVYLNAGTDLTLEGRTHLEVEVLHQKLPIPDMKATLDVKQMVKKVVDRIVEKHGGKIAKVGKVAGKALNDAKGKIGDGAKVAMKYAKLGVSNAKHLHPKNWRKPVNKHICREQCIPNRAKDLIGKVLPPSKQAVQLFHDELIGELIYLEGSTPAETRSIRESLFKSDWDKLMTKIEEDWKSIWEDKFYYGLFIRQSAAIKGGNIYRDIVSKRKQEYIQLRDRLYKNLVSATLPSLDVEYDKTAGCGTFTKNGKAIKKHCGWSKNWHTILSLKHTKQMNNSKQLIMFYERETGIAQFYQVDKYGNMALTKEYQNFSTNWKKISWIPDGPFDGVIVFKDDNGVIAKYQTDDRGNIRPYYSFNEAMEKGYVRLKNRQDNTYLNIEQGPLVSSNIGDGAHSSRWILEPFEGHYRLKNRWKQTYIHVEHKNIEVTPIGIGARSSHWTLEQVPGTNAFRIVNRWKKTYIISVGGKVYAVDKMSHVNHLEKKYGLGSSSNQYPGTAEWLIE